VLEKHPALKIDTSKQYISSLFSFFRLFFAHLDPDSGDQINANSKLYSFTSDPLVIQFLSCVADLESHASDHFAGSLTDPDTSCETHDYYVL
jgi:hypothetical protein